MTDYPTSLLPDRGRCTGCGACASGCPKGAIHMLPDREGFLYPTVTDACIQCGHCAHICPVLKQREPRPEPAVFAAWNPDASVRQTSTAGGVFPCWRSISWTRAAWCSARPWTRSCGCGTSP